MGLLFPFLRDNALAFMIGIGHDKCHVFHGDFPSIEFVDFPSIEDVLFTIDDQKCIPSLDSLQLHS